MNLVRILEQRKQAVVDQWTRRVAATYPAHMKESIEKGGNRFANPVSSTITEAIAAVYDALLQDVDRTEMGIAMDPVVRLRAIQDFSPAEAVGFVFELKEVVRKVLASEIRKQKLTADVVAFEQRIDQAALAAFDTYMGCREQLMKIRADRERHATMTLLERAGYVGPLGEVESPAPLTGKGGGER